MSPAVAGVRNHLFVQAALTLLFGLLRPGSTAAWTVGTVALALAAVGLGAALKPTPTMRTAVLGFEGAALAFGVVGLTQGHYVPGTIIGIHLLVKLFQTSADEFTAAAPAPAMAPAPDGAAAWPPAPVPPAGWPAPVAPTVQDSAPWAAPAPAGWAPPPPAGVEGLPAPDRVESPLPPQAPLPQVALAPAPFLPPQPGAHPGGRTVVPLVPQQPLPPQQVAQQPPVPVPAVPAASVPVPEQPSALEGALRTVVEAEAPEAAPVTAPEPVPVVAPPTTAPQCMTILPG